MREALLALVQDGFYPVSDLSNPIVRIISETNVAAVVPRDGFVVGLNSSAWEGHSCDYGLVPSSQGIRVILADLLQKRNEGK